MDTPDLSTGLLTAGQTYRLALNKLGLRPEALMWGYDEEAQRFELFIVWSGVDRFGPLQITRRLFKAYNLSALPQEIDPFIVNLISPKSGVYREAIAPMLGKAEVQIGIGFGPRPEETKPMVTFRPSWVYIAEKKRRTPVEINRDWRKFTQSVDQLAA